jgi:hypothetical protein
MFFNWEHKDIELTLASKTGNFTLLYQKTGQNDYHNNIFTAIPTNGLFAEQMIVVNQSQVKTLKIKGNECYQCWYFFVIQAATPANTQYRFTVSKVPEKDTRNQRILSILVDTPS